LVPRPDYIADLHAAKYDLHWCAGIEKAKCLAAYKAKLAIACAKSGLSSSLLEAAVAKDFGKWVKDEALPKSPKPNAS
jgi:hypothetical protein